MTLLLYDSSVIEVNIVERQEVWRVGVRTDGALQDELLQLTLPQLLIQLLHRLPSVLVDVGDIVLPPTGIPLSRRQFKEV